MKKISVTLVCLAGFLAMGNAQPLLNNYSAFEDFSTETEYVKDAQSNFGLTWWTTTNANIVLTRDFANKELDVTMPQGAYQYNAFGISFGDSNGAAAGGTPNTIDLSGNGIFSFDIQNTGTEGLSVRVSCTDINNLQVDCSPGAKDFSQIWSYQTQMIVPAGEKLRFEPGTPNGAGGGTINNCDFADGVWGDYGTSPHIIRTDCDLKRIKQINITVLNSEKNTVDYHALPLVNGQFSISNFIVGDTSATAVSGPEPSLTLEKTAIDVPFGTVYTTIQMECIGNWGVKSSATWAAGSLRVAKNGKDSIVVTSFLNNTGVPRTATLTLTAAGVEPQTITINQAAKVVTGIDDVAQVKKTYRVEKNTIFFEDTSTSVYSIEGKKVSLQGRASLVLEPGSYIVKSKNNSELIVIE